MSKQPGVVLRFTDLQLPYLLINERLAAHEEKLTKEVHALQARTESLEKMCKEDPEEAHRMKPVAVLPLKVLISRTPTLTLS